MQAQRGALRVLIVFVKMKKNFIFANTSVKQHNCNNYEKG